jgi:hypothetical protein
VANGGQIEIHAVGVTIGGKVSVKGYGGTSLEQPGGDITIDSEGDLTINAGTGLIADSAKGAGGEITLTAEGTITCARPLKASGTSSVTGGGGSIQLRGERVAVDNDVLAAGSREGGSIEMTARGGGLVIGTGSTATLIDVSGDNGHDGGEVSIEARGSHVTLGERATLRANNQNNGGAGGSIEVSGVDITAASGSKVVADGATGAGGTISVESRGLITLTPDNMQASNGQMAFVYRAGTPVIGSGVVGSYALLQRSTLSPSCGDGIRLSGSEACDEPDLNDQTCQTQGFAGGTLRCSSSCTFDVTGCN